ncbi:MAG TPA: phosphomethylpyrimidine synthase ThiC, partial [Phycisphaerae bacterium]|nr:phosphomethylpyrimidine synthase ThiC [Phycisphaerae bacterium]
MTQLEQARKGLVTDPMRAVAEAEGLDPETVRARVAAARIAIPFNRLRRAEQVMGVGEGLRVKVNANIGTSPDYADVATELEKLKAAEE